MEMEINVFRNTHAVARPQESWIAENQGRRKRAGAEQFLRPENICEDQVEKSRALDQPAFNRAPFLSGDEQRDNVQLPRTIHPLRITINVVGDAVFANDSPGILRPDGKLFRSKLLQGTPELLPMTSKFAGRGEALVVQVGATRVTSEEPAFSGSDFMWRATHQRDCHI